MILKTCASMLIALAISAHAATPETPKLRIAVVPIAGFTPIYAADKLGYFKDEGLEVTIDKASGGAQTLPLLVQGTLQLAVTPVVSVALANQQGFNLRVIPPALDETKVVPGAAAQVVLIDSPIRSPTDLAGKRVAVNAINSVNWLYDRAYVRQFGKIDPAQVQYLEVPFPSMIDALLNKSVDVINVAQPFIYIAVATGKARVLSYPFVAVQPGLQIAPYAGTAAWLDANPNTVAAFVKAMRKAVEYMRANQVEASRLVAEFTGVKPELIAAVPINVWSTSISADDVEQTLQVMTQEGMLKKKLDARSLIQPLGQ